MKKLLFVAVIGLFISAAASAQQGTLLVGGNFNIVSTKTAASPNDTKTSSFELNPTVGYQFTDNWTAGLTANIASQKYTNSANVSNKVNQFGAGPFIRYAKSISTIFAVFGQVQGVFGTQKSGSLKSSIADINAFPAIFINVKEGFGLNFSVGGIGYTSTKPSGGEASHSFGINFGKTLSIGLSKNFGLRKKK